MPSDRPIRPATPRKQAAAARTEGCKIGELLHFLGEQYVLDILHVFTIDPKPRRFVDLQRELKLSPNTLTDRLQGLVKAGLLTRTAYNEIPPRVEYAPTPKAQEFDAVFKGLTEWAGKHTLAAEPSIET
jgi:DNA-binding HxlR family transcriptional regulator